jgi:N-formylglutamate amidohydrolase
MRIFKDVERLLARRTVSVGSSVYIDIHSMRR